MATEIGSLLAKIGVDSSGFSRGMADGRAEMSESAARMEEFGATTDTVMAESGAAAEGSAAKFGLMRDSIAGVKGMMLGLVPIIGAIEIGKFLKDGVEGAADLEVQQRRTNTVFGAASKLVNQFGKESAKSWGMSTDAALKNVSSLGQTFTSLGMGKKQAAGLSVGFAKMSSNLAAFTGAKPADVFQALKQGALGATRGLKQYGIDITTADIQNQALAMGLVKPIKNTADLQAAQAKMRSTTDAVTAAVKKYGPSSTQAAVAEAAHAKASDALQKAMAGTVPKLTTLQKATAATALITKDASVAQGDWKKHSTDLGEEQATLGAELSNLDDTIGKALLPTITQLGAWLTVNLPTGIADTRAAFQDAKPTILAIADAIGQVVTVVREHWSQISAVIKAQIDLIKAQFNLFGDLIHGRWGAIWDDVKAILVAKIATITTTVKLIGPMLLTALQAAGTAAVSGLKAGLRALPGAMEAGLRALPGLAGTAAGKVADALVKGIKAAVPMLTGLAGDLTGKIQSAVTQVAGWAFGAAKAIGSSIVGGVISGIKSVPGAIGGAIKGAVSGGLGWAANHIGSTADEASSKLIGVPLAQGIIRGFLLGSASLPTNISTSVSNALNAAKTVVTSQLSTLTTAFGNLGTEVGQAFDAGTTKGLAKIQSRFDKLRANAATKGGKATPAEAQLAALQANKDQAGRNDDKNAALVALAAAQTSGDPAAILAAQAQLNDALYNQQVADLTAQAATERTAADNATAAKQATYDTQQAKAQLNYQAARDLQKTHLDNMLTDLQAQLAKHPDEWKKINGEILDWFKKHGNPDLQDAGKNLGLAFITGLGQTKEAVGKAAAALAAEVSKYLKLNSPAERGPLASLDTWWSAMPKTLLSGIDQKQLSDVTSGITNPGAGLGMALAMQGGGSGIAIHVNGVAITDQMDAYVEQNGTKIRNSMLPISRGNGTIFRGRA